MIRLLLTWARYLTRQEAFQLFSVKRVMGSGGPIMTQFTILALLGVHFRVHVFHRGDGDLFHSHPRHFVSIGICGEYHERLCGVETIRSVRAGVVTVRTAETRHNVTPIRFPCATFAITSPIVRAWEKGECIHETESVE